MPQMGAAAPCSLRFLSVRKITVLSGKRIYHLHRLGYVIAEPAVRLWDYYNFSKSLGGENSRRLRAEGPFAERRPNEAYAMRVRLVVGLSIRDLFLVLGAFERRKVGLSDRGRFRSAAGVVVFRLPIQC